jgi:hypothetical protein
MRDRKMEQGIRREARAHLRDAVEGYIELGEVKTLVTELQLSAEIVGVSGPDFEAAVKHYQDEAAWRAEQDYDNDDDELQGELFA